MLGPVHLDGSVPIGNRKTLLAARGGRPVTVAGLMDALWDEPLPAAVKTVQAHLSLGRSALAAAGAGGIVGFCRLPAP